MMKKFLYLILAAVLLCLMVPGVLAQEERSDTVVTVAHDEVIDDDLYVSGESVIVDGVITGDLISAATQTTINGTVEGDVLAMERYLIINGDVGGSVRTTGMMTTVSAKAHIGKDLFFVGYGLNVAEGSLIEGDVRFYGGQGLLHGDVGGDVIMSGAGVVIDGDVGGDVKANVGAEVGSSAFDYTQFLPPDMSDIPMVIGGIQIGDEARISGQVSVTAPENANLAPIRDRFSDATIVETAVTESPAQNPWLKALTRLISLLLVGALVAGVKPVFVSEVTGFLEEKPIPSFGWGILVYFLFPLFLFLLLGAFLLLGKFFGLLSLDLLQNGIFLIGILVLVVLLIGMMLIMLFLTKIVAGCLIGRFIFRKIKPELNDKAIWPVLLGLVIVGLLISIPFIGWLFNMLLMLSGLGALIVMWRTLKYPAKQEAA
ncbi:MAG: hypothetical protein CSA11_03240 [Chloroflexi bacterium]|nr:MAG: hypothetical protein CSB13_01045 [Chloroflexota bacterium]PIE81678.1 MAG: hypothetical protein CSA11_03240 [Chloroflexota bacterium]